MNETGNGNKEHSNGKIWKDENGSNIKHLAI